MHVMLFKNWKYVFKWVYKHPPKALAPISLCDASQSDMPRERERERERERFFAWTFVCNCVYLWHLSLEVYCEF